MVVLLGLALIFIYIDISLFNCILLKRNKENTKLEEVIGNIDKVKCFLYSICIYTFIVVAANEVLSVFRAISYFSISVLWSVINVIAVIILSVIAKRERICFKTIVSQLSFFNKKHLNWINIFTVCICFIAVIMALFTVPYNWDSMTYHMTRIVHWIQNRSVAHYVCHDISQISVQPLSEFVNLHVYILSGNTDYFVNLLQTFSYIISIALVYVISFKIGCNQLFSSLAALVFATTPIAFSEALNTQVDVYSGLWLLVFVYFILEFTSKSQKLCWNGEMLIKLLALGTSAAFCYLSKPSVCIAALVFIVWLLIVCIARKDEIQIVIKSVLIVGICALAIALPEMVRNFVTFHALSDTSTSTGFLVPTWDIRFLISNLVQNIGFNLPNVFFDVVWLVDKIVFKIIHVLYLGDEIPATLLDFRFMSPTDMNHDRALNPIITWLMIFAIVFGIFTVIARKKEKREKQEKFNYDYAIVSIISFFAFCISVRWYLFVTRYEVGYLALLAPAVMLIFQYIFEKKEAYAWVFTGIICFMCLVNFEDLVDFHKDYLYFGDKRETQYFHYRGLYGSYTEIAEIIKQKEYKEVGFLCGVDSYEYPFWKMLEDDLERFEHVCVTTETQMYDDSDFQPECIIAVDVEECDVIVYHGVKYDLLTDVHGVRLYE